MHNLSGTRQRGFSLIELMIAMAIVAVLATLALPAYSAYVNRAKMTEGIVHLSAAKTSIAEFLANHSRLPSVEEVTETLPNGPVSTYISSIEAEIVNTSGAGSSDNSAPSEAVPAEAAAPPQRTAGRGPPAHAPAHGLRAQDNRVVTRSAPVPAASAAPVEPAPAGESTLRLVARMNPDAFMGMRANENDRLMLEAQWVGGSLRWTCKPYPGSGVQPDWLPASCRP